MLNRYLLAAGGLLASIMLVADGCPPCEDGDGDDYCVEEDCDDSDPSTHPGAQELCDGKDNNCDDILPPNEADADGDGYSTCGGDCNDADRSINPKASEVCNGKDDNCDGAVPASEQDADGDGFSACKNDCNDGDSTIFPGATELCDSIDNNCDGVVPADEGDADQDGVRGCDGDCDDSDPKTLPGGTEVCDARDQDCDGLADAVAGTSSTWVRSVCGAVIQGTPGATDALGDDQPAVIYNADLGIFQMWFRMVDGSGSAIGRIGYAESNDGAVWTKQPSPVLNVGASGTWDALRVGFPSVVLKDGLYHMWYQGQDAQTVIRIGYATSIDGKNWTRYQGNPVLQPGASGSWDSKSVQAPTVLWDDTAGKFRMWHTGSDGTNLRTGYADSTDGRLWTKYPTPVLNAGGAGSWDSKRVVFARVHHFNGLYHMWYSGDDTNNTLTYEIGYASSTDGLTWTKLDTNPVFSFGASGSFDSFMVYGADVLPVADGYSMFYSGGSTVNGPYAIGIARNSSPTVSFLLPSPQTVARQGAALDFALELEDTGVLDGGSVIWMSDRDGFIGHSFADADGIAELSSSKLSAGDHVITALIFDEGGLMATATVPVTID